MIAHLTVWRAWIKHLLLRNEMRSTQSELTLHIRLWYRPCVSSSISSTTKRYNGTPLGEKRKEMGVKWKTTPSTEQLSSASNSTGAIKNWEEKHICDGPVEWSTAPETRGKKADTHPHHWKWKRKATLILASPHKKDLLARRTLQNALVHHGSCTVFWNCLKPYLW